MISKAVTGYLVIGSQGQYEDYSEWPVAVFTSKNAAAAHAFLCKEKAQKSYEDVKLKRQQRDDSYDQAEAKGERWEPTEYPEPEPFPEDPHAEIDCDTGYRVEEIQINPAFSKG